ncbi:SPOR domain-containing protein [Pseudovibrio axinellae]|uniref:SPOR domain-containing protein n=1 Tax=Pseudovibrio axinellae TaxID=989403 RepID=UPI001AD8BFC3|nr:SPOR domain-containing protein [Pseudovibrio axinellae]
MKLRKKIIELREDPQKMREQITVLAWGLFAVSFVALAVSAVQLPGQFAQQKRQLPQVSYALPASGPVETTASIGQSLSPRHIQVYSGVFNQPKPEQYARDSKDLAVVRTELVSLRRTMLHLTEQNRRLAVRLNSIDVASSSTQDEPSTQLKQASASRRAVVPTPKTTSPVETLPAPETANIQVYEASAKALPLRVFTAPVQIKEVVLPKATALQTVAAIPTTAMPDEELDFKRTPEAGTFHQSGARKITRTRFAVDLGRFDDQNVAKNRWKTLKEDNLSILSSLQERVTSTNTDSGTYYRLLAGPFFNAADTAVVCARLTREKVNCLPTVFQ